MSIFYKLNVADIRRETHDTVSVAFDVPMALKTIYSFGQGQYLNLQTRLAGEMVCRSYSIHSSPGSGELRVAIKHVQGGRFSTFANTELRVGDTLEVSPPQGGLTLQQQLVETHDYLGVAIGSGITALLPLLGSILDREPASSFTLLYGATTRSAMLFREQLESKAQHFGGRLRLVLLFSRDNGGDGQPLRRLDASTCDKLLNGDIDVKRLAAAFICGSPAMIGTVKHSLLKAGLELDKIHAESLSGTIQSTTPGTPQVTA